ncbi:nucleotidyltransferase family protein [Alkalimonas delamerensis]|uniref:Nucleotidyltransferase family protein n=1 Tax=Alkalimonas delamerensis TaxID=265981 RepID=A0ABT9GMA7_9GAMM|nr:nucleotidyltransferase family protein [Alkalimonas delamerensis]MDP4528103.1 nucleotidyltransferase family protein [Alkalimonas delamerensis]
MLPTDWLMRLVKSPEAAVAIPEQHWPLMVRLLRKHQLLARYGHWFRQAGVFEQLPHYAQHHLRNAEILASKQQHQVVFEAAELVSLLAPLGVCPVFLKGAAYSLAFEASVGSGRTYSDIDVLVPKEQITAVEQRLALHGYYGEAMTAYDQHYYRRWTHEIPPIRHHSRGTVLDIHHNLIPPISGRAPDMAVFLQQLVQSPQGFQVLALPAMTLHSLVHLLFNEEFKHGFRDLTDLHLLFGQFRQADDWQQLLQLAQQTGFLFELFLACRYCKQLLGTSFPEFFLDELAAQQRNQLHQALLDFIFLRVLCPRHPVTDGWQHRLADQLSWLRGHWLKMPLSVLLWHTAVKSSRAVMMAVLGKSYFEPERR